MKCFELYDHFKKNQSRLGDVDWLAKFLRPHCLFALQKLPGSNLRLLQNPREFAEFLIFMGSKRVSSYLEIGVSTGGTFFMTDSYLRAVNPDFKISVGCDKNNPPPDFNEYHWRFPSAFFRPQTSDQLDLGRERYDLAFIDACHSEEWVLHDFEKVRRHCRYVAFHDIVLSTATVGFAWEKIKTRAGRHWEFIDRSLVQTLGIGVVEVKKADAPRNRQDRRTTDSTDNTDR